MKQNCANIPIGTTKFMRNLMNNALQSDIPPTTDVLSKAITRTAYHLGLSQKELSEIIGSSKSEISRLFSNKSQLSPNTKEGECALLLIRIYRSLDALLGEDDIQCQEWFRKNNLHLGQKPILLAKKIEGLVAIISYLDAMRGMA